MDMLLNYWCTLTTIKQVTNQNHWANTFTQSGTKLYVKKTFCTYCSTEQNNCNWTSLNFRLRAPPLSVQLCVVNSLCCDWSGQVMVAFIKFDRAAVALKQLIQHDGCLASLRVSEWLSFLGVGWCS